MKPIDVRGLATAIFSTATPSQRRAANRELAYQEHDLSMRALDATPGQLDAARYIVASGMTSLETAMFAKMASSRRITATDLNVLRGLGYIIDAENEE